MEHGISLIGDNLATLMGDKITLKISDMKSRQWA